MTKVFYGCEAWTFNVAAKEEALGIGYVVFEGNVWCKHYQGNSKF